MEFESGGSVLRGRLFTADAEGPAPGIVMAPGFSVTIGYPVFEHYARAIADIGVTSLLFDYRGFGRSDGQPRQQINPWEQVRDYLAAVRFLRDLDDIDDKRVAVWGVSTSTAIAGVAAAIDPNVAAVVLQVPSVGDELSPPDSNREVFEKIKETALNADLDSFDRTVVGPLPVVSPDQLNSPSFVQSLTAFRWFIENGGRFGTGWSNQATFVRLATPAPFDVQACIPQISAPILMIVGDDDEENDTELSIEVFTTAGEPKQLLTVDGGHFGVLWPNTPEYERSAHAQQEFLKKYLIV